MTGEEAVDGILRHDPRNIRALVEKADFRTRAGDERTAAAFYRAALREAAAATPLPLELKPHIERAQATMARAAQA
nr:hypothetical protein [Lysobacter sp.]